MRGMNKTPRPPSEKKEESNKKKKRTDVARVLGMEPREERGEIGIERVGFRDKGLERRQ